jgi:hypothetical protein
MGAILEDEPARLAEISRTIQDFRNEFREAMKGMVRRDVYDANMQMIQLQLNNFDAKMVALQRELDSKIVTLQREREEDEKARRSVRALAVGIAIPGTISFLIAIVNWLMR